MYDKPATTIAHRTRPAHRRAAVWLAAMAAVGAIANPQNPPNLHFLKFGVLSFNDLLNIH